LTSSRDFADLGVHEYYESGGVCLIEWADKVRDVLPDEYLEIRISITGEESRRMELIAHGEQYKALASGAA
jgi:tRNA threonylcarbamoyladenosine biosynthesis protein TsaE